MVPDRVNLTMRVLLKASSPVAQAGLRAMLEEESDLDIVSASSGAPHALDSLDKSSADLYLIEVETLSDHLARQAIDSASAGAPVVLLVRNPALEPVAEALRAGVKAVLPSSLGALELVVALKASSLGLVVLQNVETLLSAVSAVSRPERLTEALTAREQEVLRLVAAGLGNKEVASRLEISEHTAKFHVASIMGKLGASSRTEAVTLGIRYGLVML